MEAHSLYKRPYPFTSAFNAPIPLKSQRFTGVEGWYADNNPSTSSDFLQPSILTADSISQSRKGLDLLPEESLIAIFHHLPCRDRMRLERVSKRWRQPLSHGWAEFKHFSSIDRCSRSNLGLLSMVLDRCGRFLESVQLGGLSGLADEGYGILEKCPKTDRIEFDNMQVDSQIIDYLRERHRAGRGYSRRRFIQLVHFIYFVNPFYSRSLSFTIPYFPEPTLFSSLNSMLAECVSTLGSVEITIEFTPEALTTLAELKLPPLLRQLSLSSHGLLLSGETLDAMLPAGLRSYMLQQWNPPVTLLYLGVATFTRRLTHLCVPVSDANLTTLISAIANMPMLKALELAGDHYSADGQFNWDAVIRAIATRRPELEHLPQGP